MDDSLVSSLVSSNSASNYGLQDAQVSSTPALEVEVASSDDSPAPPTKQQKIIKAGLLLLLVAVIVYVILDYTVRGQRVQRKNKTRSPTAVVLKAAARENARGCAVVAPGGAGTGSTDTSTDNDRSRSGADQRSMCLGVHKRPTTFTEESSSSCRIARLQQQVRAASSVRCEST